MNISIINFTVPQTGSFLVDIIYWLATLTSSIAVGIILFTVILKLITFPFDLFSRISMRKNSLKMEEMRPELEKLQKQYANDKNLYNQKMMALYKKNGYSMWGSCLPTIITLVIFIIAINAFTDYSHFQNQQYFYNMSLSYNTAIYEGFEADGEYIVYDEQSKTFEIKVDKLKEENLIPIIGSNDRIPNTNINIERTTEGFINIWTDNGYIIYHRGYNSENGFSSTVEWKVRTDYFYSDNAFVTGEDFKKAVQDKIEILNSGETLPTQEQLDAVDDEIAANYIKNLGRERSAKTYHEENVNFLWVKNLWMPDSMFANPIYDTWNEFVASYGYNTSNSVMTADDYNELIYNLNAEKTAYNGYFILVILTAGLSFVSQIVMSKSQKAQMELQTVDGQGAQTQKMMKWLMPIMMAVFSFMYTAAFSIYIILSTTISMLLTITSNYFIDKKYKMQQVAREPEKVRGRIYTQKEEVKEEPKKKEKKKKQEIPENDFLSGLADKKKNKKR